MKNRKPTIPLTPEIEKVIRDNYDTLNDTQIAKMLDVNKSTVYAWGIQLCLSSKGRKYPSKQEPPETGNFCWERVKRLDFIFNPLTTYQS